MTSIVMRLFVHLCIMEAALACSGAKMLLRSGGLTCHDKEQILNAFNELRSRVAIGHVDYQPPAQDMMEMCWDDSLANSAQTWANNCLFKHDENNIIKFNFGQNVHQSVSQPIPDSLGHNPDFKSAINEWFSEAAHYGYNGFYRAETAHFSQVIWGSSYLVGCGYSYFLAGKEYTKLYVCNIAPRGNQDYLRPYTIGNPLCKNLGISKKYSGLCVNEECASSRPCKFYRFYSTFYY